MPSPPLLVPFVAEIITFLRSFGGWLFHVSPALITVIGGTLIIQKQFVRRANAASFIDSLLEELTALQELALEYWNSDLSTGPKQAKASVVGQKLKGTIMAINDDLEHFYAKYGRREHKGKVDPECEKCMAELMIAATGGDFEVAKRKPDPSRYLVIIPVVGRIRSHLRKTKL